MKSVIYWTLGLVLLLMAPPAQAQSEKSNAAAAERRRGINQELGGLASELAKAMSHPGFRGHLRAAIAQSKKREHLLDKHIKNGIVGPHPLDVLLITGMDMCRIFECQVTDTHVESPILSSV